MTSDDKKKQVDSVNLRRFQRAMNNRVSAGDDIDETAIDTVKHIQKSGSLSSKDDLIIIKDLLAIKKTRKTGKLTESSVSNVAVGVTYQKEETINDDRTKEKTSTIRKQAGPPKKTVATIFDDTTSAEKIHSLLLDQKDLSAQDLDKEQQSKFKLMEELSELTNVLKTTTTHINETLTLQNKVKSNP
jgi:hypothetical protein